MVCIIPKKRKQFVSIDKHISSTQTYVQQGSVLVPLHFLLYINDLNKSIKNLSLCRSGTASKKDEPRSKKSFAMVNVKKTELIIFNPKTTKLDYSVKFKLSGKRPNAISTVTYLGILLDEHL